MSKAERTKPRLSLLQGPFVERDAHVYLKPTIRSMYCLSLVQ